MKTPRIVGSYIRKRREALSLSQRALGQLFDPPVTTQFISNVERGVTPLPLAHVPTLAKALGVGESEMMALLQKEYALKLSGRMSKAGKEVPAAEPLSTFPSDPHVKMESKDVPFFTRLYCCYRRADSETREAFHSFCRNVLDVKSHDSEEMNSEQETDTVKSPL